MFVHASVYIFILMGVTGCMSDKQSSATANEMLEYLEGKYGEEFEEEVFEEGSSLFPEMYRGDKMLAYPSANEQIPFYVHKNVKSNGFNDNYVLSEMSYRFTEKYKETVQNMDEREKAVKLSFGCGDVIDNPSYFNTSVDEFAQDSSYDCEVHLEIAINGAPIDGDREFISNLYHFMKERTIHDFNISLGYIDGKRFEEAKELIRIAHTINFSWTIIDDAVLEIKQVDSEDDIEDPTFFESM